MCWWWEFFEESSDNEEEHAHAHGGDKERRLATERVDQREYEECCCDDLDDAVDACGKKGVGMAGVADLWIRCHNGRDFERQRTHRGEDLRRIIPNRILPTKLLEKENEKCDEKPDSIALSQERFT